MSVRRERERERLQVTAAAAVLGNSKNEIKQTANQIKSGKHDREFSKSKKLKVVFKECS
jgi:hypothetical protein